MTKKRYAIKWTNSFGNRVFYPEKTWATKAAAKKALPKIAAKKMRTNTKMRNVRFVRL